MTANGTHGKPRGKDMVNSVMMNRRKASDFEFYTRITPELKWQAAWWSCFVVTIVSSFAQPEDSVFLKVLLNVDGGKLGHLVVPRIKTGGIHNASEGEGTAGVGRRIKQMPSCNGVDREKPPCNGIFRPKGSPLLAGLVERELSRSRTSVVTLDNGPAR